MIDNIEEFVFKMAEKHKDFKLQWRMSGFKDGRAVAYATLRVFVNAQKIGEEIATFTIEPQESGLYTATIEFVGGGFEQTSSWEGIDAAMNYCNAEACRTLLSLIGEFVFELNKGVVP